MTTLMRLHDEWLLRFVQEWLYAGSPFTAVVFGLLLLGLPTHRRVGAAVTAAAAVAALVCLVGYAALSEAPVLGWVMVAGLVYRAAQLVRWLAPGGPPARVSRLVRWTRPRTGWFTAVLRDYFRADPRGVYWFDTARAARGLPVRRTPAERWAALNPDPDLPEWRCRLWHGIVFGLAEARIALLRKLPRYWHRPHESLDLDEPSVRLVLEGELTRSRQMMIRCQAGADFKEFCTRSPDEHRRQAERAGRHGRVHCLLREARAEYIAFREPWPAGDAGLIEAAAVWLDTWRTRREFDTLWHPPAPPAAPAPLPALPPAPLPATEATAEPDEEVLMVGDDEPDEPEGLTDEALFEQLADEDDEAPAAEAGAVADAVRSPRDEERLADLRAACALLEAYLDEPATGEFRVDVAKWERLLDRPSYRRPAMTLLMLHCLRADHTGPGVERLKAEVVGRLRERFRGPAPRDARGREEWQAYDELTTDVLLERGDVAGLRARLSERQSLTLGLWKVLGDATATLAGQLVGRDDLRDLLLNESIGHYFRAGYTGLWTPACVGRLVGVHTVRETLDLFDRHPVRVSRPVGVGLVVEDAPAEEPPALEPAPVPQARPAARPAARALPPPPPPRPAARPLPPEPPARPLPPPPRPTVRAQPPEPPRPTARPLPPEPPRPTARPLPPEPPMDLPEPEPAAAPILRLRVRHIRGSKAHPFQIKTFPCTVGQRKPAVVAIHDPKLATPHFEIDRVGTRFGISDPNGNGITVNGKRVRAAMLAAGDVIQAGDSVFEVEAT